MTVLRSYLYYVATEYVEINIERVKIRVVNGGHPVPEDKIRKRYTGSLGSLSKLLSIPTEHSSSITKGRARVYRRGYQR